jgi:hypothetical protein
LWGAGDPILDAIWLGIACVLAAFWGRSRKFEPYLPILTVLVVGLAFVRGNLSSAWMMDSLVRDVPWKLAVMAGFFAVWSRSGWIALSGFWGAVVGGVLVGDLAVAVGLTVYEPDADRRAKLALTASGASLIGRGGAAPLILGWEPKVAGLGLLLVAVGLLSLRSVSGSVSLERPRTWKEGLLGLSSALCAGILVWVLAAGGVLEFAALQLEQLPVKLPGLTRILATLVGFGAGLVFDEGAAAVAAKSVLERALSLKSDWALQSLIAGIGVGGGLQCLVLARGSFKVGLPLLGAQAVVLALWVLSLGPLF